MAKTAVAEGVRSLLLLTERGESRRNGVVISGVRIVHGGRDLDRVVIPAETFPICGGGISLFVHGGRDLDRVVKIV
ncbi:hypothetical protein L195_g046114 [Trifolium pratense]|uniref:Uncharacterized protein n=2 Tax=Trifolium pratense TaxID=57577 RepID=A0A2K3MGU4_TRIPR|nr:hypothetical protein L195_g046114 [Trifolium pratense]CAJ2640490.1 unnamed protein product [Trifolium pratense]